MTHIPFSCVCTLLQTSYSLPPCLFEEDAPKYFESETRHERARRATFGPSVPRFSDNPTSPPTSFRCEKFRRYEYNYPQGLQTSPIALPTSTPTALLLARGLPNMLEELTEAHLTSHGTRPAITPSGRHAYSNA